MLPGRMFRAEYRPRGLRATNPSRSLDAAIYGFTGFTIERLSPGEMKEDDLEAATAGRTP